MEFPGSLHPLAAAQIWSKIESLKHCWHIYTRPRPTKVGKGHLYQGLSKHQEVSSTPVTKVTKLIVVFWDLFGAIKNLILEDKYQTDQKKN